MTHDHPHTDRHGGGCAIRSKRRPRPNGTGHSQPRPPPSWPPQPLKGDGPATLARLATLLQAMPGVKIVQDKGDGYLYAQCTTRWLKFVDDLELWFDPASQVVQVRSASRVGRKDFGVNRERVELLRTGLAASN